MATGSGALTLGITVRLTDLFSSGLSRILGKIEEGSKQIQAVSGALAASGAVVTGLGLSSRAAIGRVASSFALLEDASARLQSVIAFREINALAISLGDELPGTTSDFLQMMSALKEQGLADESILSGVGDATARMAVLLKQTPAQMAEFSAKLKTAMGVADTDMLAFMDTIQRTAFMGVRATEMMYAFGRSGGALKTLGLQGLAAGKALETLYAMWIRGGVSGETVGTGFASLTSSLMNRKKVGEVNAGLAHWGVGPLRFTDDKGNFAGIENMIGPFDKLKNLNATRLNKVLQTLTGGGQDQSMAAAREQLAAMEAQASLNERVRKALGTLASVWEAASGTFGEAMGDDLKSLAAALGWVSEKLNALVKAFPTTAKWVGRFALALTALALVLGPILLGLAALGFAATSFVAGWALVGPVILVAKAALWGFILLVKGVSLALLTNPITLTLVGIVAAVMALVYAAKLLHDNWEPIVRWLLDAFSRIGEKIESIKNLIPRLSKWMPDWVGAVPSSRPAGEARSLAGGPGALVNGTIRIEVDQEGRVNAIRAATANPNVVMDVDSGLLMMLP
jgi:TP901 family phage tail tape measure protein